MDARPVHLTRLSSGAVEARLGETIVVATVGVAVVEPKKARPGEGSLLFRVEVGVPSGSKLSGKLARDKAAELGALLEFSIRGSRALDTESLCIQTGKLSWEVSIEVSVIACEGNLVDTACLAALAALARASRPRATANHGKPCFDFAKSQNFALNHLPLPISFAVFGEPLAETMVLRDPNSEEELAAGGRLSVFVNRFGDLCGVQKAGKAGIPSELFFR